jgi:transposase InsO family protein
VRDRDTKFSRPFDAVLRAEGVRVIRTPVRAPRANAFAERFVGTVRQECLDDVLIYGPRHLERVLGAYVAHYLEERPHRGLRLAVPAGYRTSQVARTTPTLVERMDVLGGLIHEYRRAA